MDSKLNRRLFIVKCISLVINTFFTLKILKLIFGDHVLGVVECRWRSINWRGYSYGMVRYEHDRTGRDYFYTIFLILWCTYMVTDLVKHGISLIRESDYSDGIQIRRYFDKTTIILGIIMIIIEVPGCTMYSDAWCLWWMVTIFYVVIDLLHCRWSVGGLKEPTSYRIFKNKMFYRRLREDDEDTLLEREQFLP